MCVCVFILLRFADQDNDHQKMSTVDANEDHVMDDTSEDEPLISSEEEDAADALPALPRFPAPPRNPAPPPEIILISSDEEDEDYDAILDTSDTSSVGIVDPDAETEVEESDESSSANEDDEDDSQLRFRPPTNRRPHNALVPPDLLNRPAALRLSAEGYDYLYLGPHDIGPHDVDEGEEVNEEDQEEEEPLIPFTSNFLLM